MLECRVVDPGPECSAWMFLLELHSSSGSDTDPSQRLPARRGGEALLARWGVTFLRSPPYCPRFNGSCERSLGWTKVHGTEFMGARGGTALS
jgi:hypothetical protein